MRTAKDIIDEFRARGYGKESLRVLADSRDEPLRSEMLALLAQEEGDGAAATEDMVFFQVSDDEEAVEVGGDIIDFDIMAANLSGAPEIAASEEESIAEIAIGDDEGSGFVQVDAAGQETAMVELVATETSVIEATPVDLAPAEQPTITPFAEETAEANEIEAHTESEASAVAEADNALAAQSEKSTESGTDYMPGSVSDIIDEPVDAVDERAETTGENETPASAMVVVEDDVNTMALVSVNHAAEMTVAHEETVKESAAERKRRRRAERKRQKAEKKQQAKAQRAMETAASSLPEIVLENALEPQAVSQVDETASDAVADRGFDMAMIPASGNLDMTVAEMRQADLDFEADDESAFVGSPYVEEDVVVGAGGSMSMLPTARETENEFFVAERAESENEGNVIRLFDSDDTERWDMDIATQPGFFVGSLRLLENSFEPEEALVEDDPSVAEAAEDEQTLSPLARLGLLRALTGGDRSAFSVAEVEDDLAASGQEHTIVQPSAEVEAADTIPEELVAELERDFQDRLDGFAKRLLEMQTTLSENETKLHDKQTELKDKEKLLAELTDQLAQGEATIKSLTGEMGALSDTLSQKSEELSGLHGLKEEHVRLYKEYEDLRSNYNEVVSNVMPSLQSERDELVLTVEQQSDDEEKLRSALKKSGRRMAVGYSLAAAATVMMVALPLVHWMGAGGSNQDLAMGKQQVGELRDRLDRAEKRNVDAEKIIFDLRQQNNIAVMELAKLEQATNDLARLSDQRTREVAQLKANLAGGTGSAITALNAGEQLGMSGPLAQDGRVHRNEVRDPGGAIDNVLAQNRERYAREDAAVLASGQQPDRNAGRQTLQVSAIARTPNATNAANAAQPAASAVQTAQKPERKGQVAVVKSGEGVAQVVYRVMKTRDPEVIAWVIRENNLKKDKRGNPRIYPDQKLLLPQVADRSATQANAARR